MTGGAYFYADMVWSLERRTLFTSDSDIERIVSFCYHEHGSVSTHARYLNSSSVIYIVECTARMVF